MSLGQLLLMHHYSFLGLLLLVTPVLETQLSNLLKTCFLLLKHKLWGQKCPLPNISHPLTCTMIKRWSILFTSPVNVMPNQYIYIGCNTAYILYKACFLYIFTSYHYSSLFYYSSHSYGQGRLQNCFHRGGHIGATKSIGVLHQKQKSGGVQQSQKLYTQE